jgi:hypothetical protein
VCVYEQIKRNVEEMKIIQLGITLSDQLGKVQGTWQFNFQFDL